MAEKIAATVLYEPDALVEVGIYVVFASRLVL